MKFGFVMPFGDAAEIADAAVVAEGAEWDALFAWESVWGNHAWVSLTAAAMLTESLRLGTMLTPVARYKPWDLTSLVVTLDRLSGGRVILGAGLGALHGGWTAFEPDEGRRVRVERLEETLDIYAGLMQGQPFSYQGRHYTAAPTDFFVPDPPIQRPHPPVWLVGASRAGATSQPSLERAARREGWLPQVIDGDFRGKPRSPEELARLAAEVRRLREDAGLDPATIDVCFEGQFHGEDATEHDVRAWADSGATWWVEGAWGLTNDDDGRKEVSRRLTLGPPRHES